MSRSRAPAAPAKGHVEVFQISDEQYYDIYLDGQHQDRIAHESPASHPLSGRFRRPLAEKAGVTEADPCGSRSPSPSTAR